MRFAWTDDQLAFRAAVRDLLAAQCGPDQLRAAWDAPDGRIPGLWAKLSQLGVTSLLVPEACGGPGGDELDLVGALEELGWHAAPEPVAEAIIGSGLLAASPRDYAGSRLKGVINGQTTVAIGLRMSTYVPAAEYADLLILENTEGVHALEAAEVSVRPHPSVDSGIRLATVDWRPTATSQLDVTPDDARRAANRIILAAAAQLVGLGRGLLAQTVRYAQHREQFGRPIGSFQAVKHQLADVYIALEFAGPLVARAAWSVSRQLTGADRDVSMAKYRATTAARLAGRVALQVHGGIGYTFEHDLHMWLKRIWSLTGLWGTPDWHLARVSAAVLDQPQPRVP